MNTRDISKKEYASTTLTKTHRKSLMSYIRLTSISARLSIIIFIFSCAFFLNHVSAALPGKPNPCNPSQVTTADLRELNIEEAEEFKRMAWNNWLMRLESEWKHFNETLEKDKVQWLEEREQVWNDWLNNMQNNWNNYNEEMHKEYKTEILEKSEHWSESQWIKWMQTEGRQIMELQWEKWVHDNDYSLNQLILNKWVQWKNNKIKSWLANEWKAEEDYYWANWEYSTTAKWLHFAERKLWLKWKERISREAEQWMNWVQMKESVYISEEWNKWPKWKNYKKILFNKWASNEIYKWTMKKQWKTWLKDCKNNTSQNEEKITI
ncbi:tryptophan-rich antigen [Plasmodium brasilianum]|uniref:Tryptophan-rich antigen n=1 Tax=Plasmodium brasilianum TaxID=5824 RepID=A0ACB9YDZ8_PLABR|nr:tryptophan-rich antigen [Plasmodium brasilianum]